MIYDVFHEGDNLISLTDGHLELGQDDSHRVDEVLDHNLDGTISPGSIHESYVVFEAHPFGNQMEVMVVEMTDSNLDQPSGESVATFPFQDTLGCRYRGSQDSWYQLYHHGQLISTYR